MQTKNTFKCKSRPSDNLTVTSNMDEILITVCERGTTQRISISKKQGKRLTKVVQELING